MRISDWSSDVCSSDLGGIAVGGRAVPRQAAAAAGLPDRPRRGRSEVGAPGAGPHGPLPRTQPACPDPPACAHGPDSIRSSVSTAAPSLWFKPHMSPQPSESVSYYCMEITSTTVYLQFVSVFYKKII